MNFPKQNFTFQENKMIEQSQKPSKPVTPQRPEPRPQPKPQSPPQRLPEKQTPPPYPKIPPPQPWPRPNNE